MTLLYYKLLLLLLSNSVRPHRRQPNRLLCPWDSPGKNTGVGCHFLLQCMKVKSESEVAQLCPTFSHHMGCSLPGSLVHGFSRQEYWSGLPLPSLWIIRYVLKIYEILLQVSPKWLCLLNAMLNKYSYVLVKYDSYLCSRSSFRAWQKTSHIFQLERILCSLPSLVFFLSEQCNYLR